MHLVKIRPDQIATHWPFLRQSLAATVPPTEQPSEEVMLRILYQALAGRLQIWVGHRKRTWPPEAFCIVATNIAQDEILGTKNLNLFGLYAWEPVKDSEWISGFETLREFALAEKCKGITFYAANPVVLKIAERFGFLTAYSFGVLHFA